MSYEKITISTWSNNSFLEKYLCEKKFEEIKFKVYQESHPSDYLCLFVDLEADQENLTSKIYNIYLASKTKSQKIAIVLLPGIESGDEKIKQFESNFSQIESKDAIHRLIICQDLYLLDPILPITPLDKYISNVVNKKEITVSHKGNSFFYPISFDNLFELIKKSLFLSNTSGKKFYAQGNQTTDLKIAYLLKKNLEEMLSFDLDINNTFLNTSVRQNYLTDTYKTSAQLNWEAADSFERDFQNYLKNQKEVEGDIENNQFKKNKSKTPSKFILTKVFHRLKAFKENQNRGDFKKNILKKIENLFEKLIVVIVLIYFLSSAIFVLSSYGSLKSLEKTVFYFKKENVVESVKGLNSFIFYKNITQTNYSFISPVIKTLFFKLDQTNQNFLGFLNYSQTAITSLHQTYTLAESIYSSVNNTSEIHLDYTDLSLALKSNLQQTYESINQLEIALDKGDLPEPLIQKVKQNLEYKQLKESREQLGEAIKIVDFIPAILGDKKSSNVFVLIQNDAEQRATGGSISYVYQISLDRGRVVYQKMFLPQEIDKIDNYTLTPPPLIEKMTGEAVWKLKDMNYNPDFPQTATNIAWYLEKKLKTKPDIVIAINTSTLEKIQKGDTREIFENLINSSLGHKTPVLELVNIVSSALSQNNLLLWSSDSNLEKNVLNQKFSGSVRDYNCHPAMSSSRQCLSQTSHLNFSNFSSIPLNNYLQKTITHLVTPTVLSINHQLDVDYEYLKNTPLLNRNLTEIVQFFTPKNSVVVEIKINNDSLPLSSLIAQEEATLTRYQFPLSTSLNSKQHLLIKYSFPLPERTLLPVSYSLTDLKQPGQKEVDSSLIIMIPEQSRASAITSEATSLPDKIIYKQTPTTSTFGVNFVPKLP